MSYLDHLSVLDLDGSCAKVHADGGFALEVKVAAGEAAKQVGLADTGVADEDDLEQKVVSVVLSHDERWGE